MPVATSTALLIGAAAALAGAGATVYGAETAKAGQKKALKFQKEQQAAAEARKRMDMQQVWALIAQDRRGDREIGRAHV